MKTSTFVLSLAATALILGRISVCEARGGQLHEPDYFAYHPKSALALGVGFEPLSSRAKPQCVTGQILDEEGNLDTAYESYLVTDSESLKRVLNIDARIDASYLTASASASFNYSYEGLFTNHSLTFVVKAENEYRPRRFNSPYKMTETAAALLNGGAGGVSAFYAACGTHLPIVERRGAKVAALLTIKGLSQQERTEIAASVQGGGSFGAGSVNVSLKVNEHIEKAASSGRLDLRVLAAGAGDVAHLGGLVRATLSGSDIAKADGANNIVVKIGDAVAQFLEKINSSKAAPLGFHVVPFSDLFPQLSAPALVEERRVRRLGDIVDAYRASDDKRASARSILSGTDPRTPLLAENETKPLRESLTQLEEYLDVLAKLHESCRLLSTELSTCVVPARPKLAVEVPALPPPPRVQILVRTDENTWTPERSEAIVVGGTSDLLRRVRVLEQQTNSAALLLRIGGRYMEGAVLKFVPNPGEQDTVPEQVVSVIPLPESGGDFVVFVDGKGFSGMLADAAAFRKRYETGSGKFVVTATDRLKRKFDIDVAQTRWGRGGEVLTLSSR